MKSPRILLAVLATVSLAACSADSITGPAAPRQNITATSEPEPTTTNSDPAPSCTDTTDDLGNMVIACTTESRGGQHGTGN